MPETNRGAAHSGRYYSDPEQRLQKDCRGLGDPGKK